MENFYLLLIAGGFGALIKEILADNKLSMPNLKNRELDLGFVGAMIIGAFAGYAIDGSYLTAAMAGFSGSAVIAGLVSKKVYVEVSGEKTIEEQIRRIAKTELVDGELAVKVAECESSLKQFATNTNTDGSVDRGLFQINSKYHPEVTQEQAFDIDFSTRFFCKAFKSGQLSWWNASRTCWEK